ncbi:ASCH domain-containing protein [Rhizobium mayense]|uniref:ASCH domain-containing protein n=1 Tax=Rhizobium mayense TaxID=1312184 RepID=A0ABT7JQ30_9HYPH|nr:ASCH domain-containing protein [Rhizobium mayense]MDL2398454.1 ASCH domain-containing protein [Rhizobium mayense]
MLSNKVETPVNDSRVSKGLVIDAPWISLILSGHKDWEMRSTRTSHRGWFGLIWKGMGCVYGVARLSGAGDPLSPDEMVATFEHHRIPEDMIRSGVVAKWNRPWYLADVRRLPTPVRYEHPNGAVTWVELGETVSLGIERQLALLEEPLPESVSTVDDTRQKDARAPFLEFAWRQIGESVLTQGNIDHNHIYLREFFDRFPKDTIGGSNKAEKASREITVAWEGGQEILTDLDGSKKLFRARGWIGTFFTLNNARAGNRVLVEEGAPYKYRISLLR